MKIQFISMGYIGEEETEVVGMRIEKSVVRAGLYCLRLQ